MNNFIKKNTYQIDKDSLSDCHSPRFSLEKGCRTNRTKSLETLFLFFWRVPLCGSAGKLAQIG